MDRDDITESCLTERSNEELAEKLDNMPGFPDGIAGIEFSQRSGTLKEYEFSQGKRGRFYSPKKLSATAHLDDDVPLYLKKLARIKKLGYQTQLNRILRDTIQKSDE
jgi:hypothetical protein